LQQKQCENINTRFDLSTLAVAAVVVATSWNTTFVSLVIFGSQLVASFWRISSIILVKSNFKNYASANLARLTTPHTNTQRESHLINKYVFLFPPFLMLYFWNLFIFFLFSPFKYYFQYNHLHSLQSVKRFKKKHQIIIFNKLYFHRRKTIWNIFWIFKGDN